MQQVSSGQPTFLTLLKCGQTQASVEGKWQGQKSDLPLTDSALESARKTAQIYKATKIFDAGYTGPLKRASTTAEEILKLFNLTAEECQDLNQRKITHLEDLTQREVMELYKQTTSDFKDKNADAIFETSWLPEIETNEELTARMMNFIHMVGEKHPGQSVLAVTHTDNIRVALRAIKELSTESSDWKVNHHGAIELMIQNGKITVLSEENITPRSPQAKNL